MLLLNKHIFSCSKVHHNNFIDIFIWEMHLNFDRVLANLSHTLISPLYKNGARCSTTAKVCHNWYIVSAINWNSVMHCNYILLQVTYCCKWYLHCTCNGLIKPKKKSLCCSLSFITITVVFSKFITIYKPHIYVSNDGEQLEKLCMV